MGKRIISQRRGRGTSRYRAKSHRYLGKASHPGLSRQSLLGKVIDIAHCPGHTAPLALIEFNNNETSYMIAPENIRVNDIIKANTSEISTGNILPLKHIPSGTLVYNIEKNPGDGGKFVRSSGTFAKVVGSTADKVIVLLPSSKKKEFNPECRASIGTVAGAGRTEKPLVKAGNKYKKMYAKGKLYPKVSGISMNAVDHPYGTSRSSKKGRPTIARKHAPPGAKVGKIRPRRTGKKR